MKILFLDAYFKPEQIAFTHLENDLLEGFVEAGNDIEIVCPIPTRGVSAEVLEQYKNKKIESLYDGHVHVTRFYAPQEGKNPLVRALRYFWCNFRTYQIAKKVKNVEAVFANSTPPTQGWIAGKVAKQHGAPFIYSLQDVFPDSLVTTGLTKQGSFLWWIGRKLENATYKNCSKIIVISESMKKNLLQKGVQEKYIQVISNWIDLNAIHPIPKEKNKLFDELRINRNKFIVLYAGNFGAAQGAEIVLDVAEKMLNRSNIQFVIFGGGAGYEYAVERSKMLPNVFIHSLLSQERVSEVYSMGDVALITCKKGVGKSGMPSKTWSIMACNTPIIASFDLDSELDRVLKDANAGYAVKPEDVDALTKEILDFYLKTKSYSNARAFLEKFASKGICVNAYLSVFKEVTT